ncbi:MarR family winged helix-turn-helix transcriptional regulator [Enterococcus casseliflavus]|uniref:MarR family winged helix-turn-helix transcriptional regulator n=1 Tax=Enterococcus casseliflavus TaxID=37734 RepID=UPI003D6B405A
MSTMIDHLMKQLRFISEASNAFMSQNNQRLSGQQRVLAVLNLEDGLVQSYLAEVLDLRPSSLAELLKKMENSGDIQRKEDAADKRIKRIYLTETGRKKAEKLLAQKEATSSQSFFAGLSEEDQTEFARLLENIAAGWETDFQQQAQRFIDPMDRLQAMQEIREEMMKQWGGNWQEMTNDERRQMKKQIKEAMRQMPFTGHRGMFGNRPFEPFGPFGPFDSSEANDPRYTWVKGNFFDAYGFGQGRKARPTSTSKDEAAEDDWQDF